jgi:hypothetical protein
MIKWLKAVLLTTLFCGILVLAAKYAMYWAPLLAIAGVLYTLYALTLLFKTFFDET